MEHKLERCITNVIRQRNEQYHRYKIYKEKYDEYSKIVIQQTFAIQEFKDENSRLLSSLSIMRGVLNRFYGIVSSGKGDVNRIMSIVYDVLSGNSLSDEEFKDIISYKPSSFKKEEDE
jgi:hypothetical protein